MHRAIEGELRHTTCVMDCPDACALEVRVGGGRIVEIGGSAARPDTAGFICSKVAAFDRRLYHPERVLHPLRRAGAKGEGRFERVTWEAAIAEIVERFGEIRRRSGGEAILPFHYGGSNGWLSDGLVDHLFFARLGASRLARTICALPATEVALGMYGKMPGVAFPDFEHARCIVVWGANPRGSNIHLVPHLRAAKRRGAFVASIDPRRTLTKAETDLHLPVLPGQDLPLALAMIAHWERTGALDRAFLERWAIGAEPLLDRAREWTLERAAAATGLEADRIRELADRMAATEPLVVRAGWGLERNLNGGQAMAAILAIPALLGKFGVRGGGYTLSNNGAARVDRTRVIGDLDWRTRELNMTQLGRLLLGDLEPPIEALFVYNANPASTVPRQREVLRGLAREDLFTVVHEQVTTDTALYADLLLPAPTFLESWDLRVGYGSYVVGALRPLVDAPGEARSNMQLFAALGRALGFRDEAFALDDETLLRRLIAALEMPGGPPDPEALLRGEQAAYDFPGPAPLPFVTTFPQTTDGKIHLTPAVLGPRPFEWTPPGDDYPLAFVSPASNRLITSTLGESNVQRLLVTLHPDDAATRGVADGDPVRVFNDAGEVRCTARVSKRIRPGVVSMPKGAWRRASANGATATTLCPDHVQVVGGAACFNDARVEVERLAEASPPE